MAALRNATGRELNALPVTPDDLAGLRGPRLTKAQENSAWFKALSPHGALVSCQTPSQTAKEFSPGLSFTTCKSCQST